MAPNRVAMGLFDILWPSSPVIASTVEDICRDDGWDVLCTLGVQAAQGLRSRAEDRSGGPLPKTLRMSTSGDVNIQFAVAFALEPSLDPGSRSMAKGSVQLLSTSRFLSLSATTGTWKVTSTDDDEVPVALRWDLQSAVIAAGGDIIIPEGPLYFNALTTAERRRRGLDVGSGRVTIREGSSLLTRSLIEQFKTVGRFRITPRNPASVP